MAVLDEPSLHVLISDDSNQSSSSLETDHITESMSSQDIQVRNHLASRVETLNNTTRIITRADSSKDVLRPRQSLDVEVILRSLDKRKTIPVSALIDSGCTGSCIDAEFVKAYSLEELPLVKPIQVYNANGTANRGGSITHYTRVSLTIDNHEESIPLLISNLRTSVLFLGHDWLKIHNPTIDWHKSIIFFDKCPDSCFDSRHQEICATISSDYDENEDELCILDTE